MSTISQFKPTLIKLETIIYQLEKSLGVEHKQSLNNRLKKKSQNNFKRKNKQEKKKSNLNKKQQKPQQQQQDKKAPAAAPQDFGPFTDFVSVDIRVGELKKVWKHEESIINKQIIIELQIILWRNSYWRRNQINCFRIIRICTYRKNDWISLSITIDYLQIYFNIFNIQLINTVVNLKPRKLAGFMSNGMVLCASDATYTKVESMRPATGSKVGERVKIQEHENIFKEERVKVLNPKNGKGCTTFKDK